MKKRWIIVSLVVILLSVLFWPVVIEKWKKEVADYVVKTWKRQVQEIQVYSYLWRYKAPWTGWLLAMIAQESAGKEGAVNPKDPSYGLMMITPGCLSDYNRLKGKSFTTADLMNPEINLVVGIWYFDFLFAQYKGDYEKIVMAYNAGQGNIEAGRPHLERVKTYLSLIQPQLT